MKLCKSYEEYIAYVAPYAQKACKRFEIELGKPFYLPSVLIAQAIHENGASLDPKAQILVEVGNMCGIKRDLLNKSWTDIGLGCWSGEYVNKKTPEVYGGVPTEIYDDFRIYKTTDKGPDVEESFMDYLCFMRWGGYSVGNPKYYPNIKDLHDYKSIAKMVHKLGYATGVTYSDALIRHVEKWNLTKYDDLTKVEPSKIWPAGAPSVMDQKPKEKGDEKVEEKIIINPNPCGATEHNTSKRTGNIDYLYIHYVGALGNGKENCKYYTTATVKASADFYVSQDGSIWQYNMNPVGRYCWAVGGGRQSQYGGAFYGIAGNANGISIEMCVKSKTGKAPANPNDPNWYITDETYKSTVKLARYLMKLYNIPENRVLRHYDVNGKYCPGVYGWNAQSGSDATWYKFKNELTGVEIAPVVVPEKPVQTGKVWKVQLGAYKRKGNAVNKLKMAQEKIAKDAFITDLCPDGYYRVQVGSFSVFDNAVKLMNSIKERKLSDACIKEYNA